MSRRTNNHTNNTNYRGTHCHGCPRFVRADRPLTVVFSHIDGEPVALLCEYCAAEAVQLGIVAKPICVEAV